MIPQATISGATLDAIVLYTAILGILLLAATILRVRIPLLRRMFIPASLLAGIIGLILGPHFLGLIPKEIMSYWSALAGRLIIIVFAPMLMGGVLPKLKTVINYAGPQILLGYTLSCLQYGVPLLLTVFLFTPVWGLNELFGVIVEQGWAGGHGTAGGMAAVFEELKYMDGPSLSLTSATVGLIFGVVGGTVMINFAARKGYTAIIKSGDARNVAPDLIEEQNRPIGSKITISSEVIESFAFHASLISVAVCLGWAMTWLMKKYLGFSIALFGTAMIGGLIVQLIIARTKWGAFVEKATMSRIQGVALEFLIAGAIASVNIPVIVEYAVPLLIQQSVIAVLMVCMIFFYCPRIFPDKWFENGIVIFGSWCGVNATGLLLLRTCDPEMTSGVFEAFAARAPFTGTFLGGGLFTAMAPSLVIQYGAWGVGITCFGLFLFMLIVPRFFGWWYPSGKRVATAAAEGA